MANRLVFFYKVGGGQVPALPSHAYLTSLQQNQRRVAVKKYTDFQTDNILESYSTNNTRCFKLFNCNSEIYKNSFFPKTVVDRPFQVNCVPVIWGGKMELIHEK